MKDLEKLLKLPLLKNKFDLQLFAEDSDNGEDGEDPDNEPNTSLKDGEGENPSDKKYSYEDVDKLISKKFAEWEKKRQKEEAKFKEAQKLFNNNIRCIEIIKHPFVRNHIHCLITT